MRISDVAAIIFLTSNESLKKEMVETCSPICQDGDKESLTSQFSNSILKKEVAEMKFNTRKGQGTGDSDAGSDSDDSGNYDGPPPPGMFGGKSSGGGGLPKGMPGFGGGGMPGFGAGMPGMNPMGGASSVGFFNAGGSDDDNDDHADGFGEEDFRDDGFGSD